MTKYIKISEENYGFIGLSKYAAQYRVESDLTDKKNVATIKLVHKDNKSMINGKSEGLTRYITLPSITNPANANEKNKASGTKKLNSKQHSEQAINEAINKVYKGIKRDEYWIKSIYTERIPCSDTGNIKRDHACHLLIEGLEKYQTSKDGPPITVYYSVEANEKINVENIKQIEGYPLASSENQAEDLREDISRDIKIGKLMEENQSLNVDFGYLPASLSTKENSRILNNYRVDIVNLSSSIEVFKSRYMGKDNNVPETTAKNLSIAMDHYIKLASKIGMPEKLIESYGELKSLIENNSKDIKVELYRKFHGAMLNLEKQITDYNNSFNEKIYYVANKVKEQSKKFYNDSINIYKNNNNEAFYHLRGASYELNELLGDMRRESWLYNKEVNIANNEISKTRWLEKDIKNPYSEFNSYLEKYKKISDTYEFDNVLKDIDEKFVVKNCNEESLSELIEFSNENFSQNNKRGNENGNENENKKRKVIGSNELSDSTKECGNRIATPPASRNSIFNNIKKNNNENQNEMENTTSFGNKL